MKHLKKKKNFADIIIIIINFDYPFFIIQIREH